MTGLTDLYHSEKIQSKLRTIVPLIFILLCPPSAMIFWYTNTMLDGSFTRLGEFFAQEGIFKALVTIWGPVFLGSFKAWTIIAVFAATQLLFMKIIPGKTFYGPITPKGNVPIYKANGLLCYSLTLTLFCTLSFYFQLFSPTLIYDNFGALLGALNVFSLLFCLFLLLKGKYAPSSNDSGSSGNLIFDYYWGTELYPRLAGWDIKMFTNCRFGMMSWPLIIISFAAKQNELYGLSDSMVVSVILQLVYVTKFFAWETGYLRSLDIMHDRAGFYICWGCLVWVPGIYTSPTLFLVNHPNHLGFILSSVILIAGTICIMANYFADRQRQNVREKEGNCNVWGKKPILTTANYVTERGEHKQNILLASGWWGVARHFHYIPEILGAFFWSVPALFSSFMPYFYVVFLTCLLFERAFRDDRRCLKKYGNDWNKYCELVPYKIIPYVI